MKLTTALAAALAVAAAVVAAAAAAAGSDAKPTEAPATGLPPTLPPTNVNKPCEEITLRWACRRRPDACDWKNDACVSIPTSSPTSGAPTRPTTKAPVTPSKPTTKAPTPKPGSVTTGAPTPKAGTNAPTTKSGTNAPTTKSGTNAPTKKAGTGAPSTLPECRSFTTQKTCLPPRCTWDVNAGKNGACRKLTLAPSRSPSRSPTRKGPQCANFRTKKDCCGKKFAQGKGPCVNSKVKGLCSFLNGQCVVRGSTPAGKPTGKPSASPTSASSEYEYEAGGEYESPPPTKAPTKKGGKGL